MTLRVYLEEGAKRTFAVALDWPGWARSGKGAEAAVDVLEAYERLILDAARGSIMELAWMVEAETGERLGINPACVVTLRATVP